MSPAPRWWPVLASSSALSLALLGDALIYAVLPVHAAAFGVSLAWVGVLLSVNRFVRVFAYGLVARCTEVFGLRRMCIVACVGAVLSTALYWAGEGTALLLFARILWARLRRARARDPRLRGGTPSQRRRAGGLEPRDPAHRAGGGAARRRLAGGRAGSARGLPGARGATCIAVPLAWSLPPDRRAGLVAEERHPALGRPRPLDGLFFLQGFGVDGVFVVSITLLIAEQRSVAAAVMSGAALLAVRHLVDAAAGPVFGAMGDRHGAARILGITVVLTAVGFMGVALDFTVAGALVLLVFRGAIASLGPVAIVQAAAETDPIMGSLARMQAWRDLGAAVGPLATGLVLGAVSAATLHGMVAALLLVVLMWWYLSPSGPREPR